MNCSWDSGGLLLQPWDQNIATYFSARRYSFSSKHLQAQNATHLLATTRCEPCVPKIAWEYDCSLGDDPGFMVITRQIGNTGGKNELRHSVISFANLIEKQNVTASHLDQSSKNAAACIRRRDHADEWERRNAGKKTHEIPWACGGVSVKRSWSWKSPDLFLFWDLRRRVNEVPHANNTHCLVPEATSDKGKNESSTPQETKKRCVQTEGTKWQ